MSKFVLFLWWAEVGGVSSLCLEISPSDLPVWLPLLFVQVQAQEPMLGPFSHTHFPCWLEPTYFYVALFLQIKYSFKVCVLYLSLPSAPCSVPSSDRLSIKICGMNATLNICNVNLSPWISLVFQQLRLGLPMQGTWVWSRAGDLRSHKLCSIAKRLKKKNLRPRFSNSLHRLHIKLICQNLRTWKVLISTSPWPYQHGGGTDGGGRRWWLLLFSHISQSLLKFTESVMPSNHLILCHSLVLPVVFPSIRDFSSHQVAKVLELQL